jgi:3-oxoacyl-(acyl-carrier-protein) synthase
MADEIDLRKINAIVGAAIKAVVESGADDEFVGAFAATHRAKVARILEHPEEALQGPTDLLALVTQAVAQALGEAGIGSNRRAPAKRINVVIAGRRTSVTLSREILDRLIEAKGSQSQANNFVQELASNLPADVPNRSRWIEERVRAFLNFRQGDPVIGAQRH